MSDKCTRLSPLALGFALGVMWAIGLFALGILSMLTGYGSEMVTLMGTVYLGYSATFLGSIIGAVWALVDGFIGGYILAWLYNWCAYCGCRHKHKTSEASSASSDS